MDRNYLKIIARLEDKFDEERRQFNSQIRNDKFFYEMELEKQKNSFQNEIEILNSIHTNLKKQIDDLKEEKKETLKEELENDFNYKKLYQCLVESLKQHFVSPISLDKMKLPFILKSGQSIGKSEFKVLYSRNQKDPFDRTKMVDTKIPNLALRYIMDTVDLFEDINKKMSNYKL